MKVQIRDNLVPLISNKAKQEQKKFPDMVNILLSRVLWQEPEIIFKGNSYKVEPEIFARVVPLKGELEEV